MPPSGNQAISPCSKLPLRTVLKSRCQYSSSRAVCPRSSPSQAAAHIRSNQVMRIDLFYSGTEIGSAWESSPVPNPLPQQERAIERAITKRTHLGPPLVRAIADSSSMCGAIVADARADIGRRAVGLREARRDGEHVDLHFRIGVHCVRHRRLVQRGQCGGGGR